ncbi:hypothetical protein PENTCL1PPCAC_24326, partial [Pristionchus entomophagus]
AGASNILYSSRSGSIIVIPSNRDHCLMPNEDSMRRFSSRSADMTITSKGFPATSSLCSRSLRVRVRVLHASSSTSTRYSAIILPCKCAAASTLLPSAMTSSISANFDILTASYN